MSDQIEKSNDRISELLESAYASLNSSDVSGFVKDFHPKIVRIESPEFPSAGTYRGIDEVTRHVLKGRSTWAEGGCYLERISVYENKVVVSLHVKVRLKDNDDWIDAHIADGFRFRDGKVIEFHTFPDEVQAIEWASDQTSS